MNMLGRRFSYIEQGNPVTMEEFSIRSTEDTPGYQSDVDTCIQGLLKVKIKFKKDLNFHCLNFYE